MAQIRGTAGYNLGGGGGSQHPFGGGRGGSNSNDDGNGGSGSRSTLEVIRAQTNRIEDWLDTLSDPIKPYVSFQPLF